MASTRLAWLYQRYFEKTATDAERIELMSLLQDPSAEAEVKALMEQSWEDFRETGTGERPHFTPVQSEELLRGVLGAPGVVMAPEMTQGVTGSDMAPVARFRITWGRAVAASLLLLVLGGSAWWRIRPVSPKEIAQVGNGKNMLLGDKAPGGDKAMLILDDGSRIALDSAREGSLARQGNAQVLKLSGGRLAYQVSDEGSAKSGPGNGPSGPGNGPSEPGNVVKYNTIVVPRGGRYQVVLPDGTKAWLNAASSLRFPTAFGGKDREVTLTGEGYFEVAKDKEHPFRVSAGEIRVDVLGTRFDVMAYSDEGSINTCLLDGSVKVTGGARSGLLRPGEQARFFKRDDLQTGVADTEQVVAWKNGLFQFDNITIEPLMRQLARWYDVQVVYGGAVNTHFSGLISRTATLTQMLKILQAEGSATYRLEGNTLIVMPH